jgi:copper chaperone NosL
MKKLLCILPLLLAACFDEEAATRPAPATLTEEAAGHYCQMIILEHSGPKAQIHLAGLADPLWFSQVRDGIAYLKSPEQDGDIVAVYVNDMGAAESWASPGPENWIDAETAFYVVGSDAIGGMGAPEIAPFADAAAASAFIATHGGAMARLDEIGLDAVLAPIEIAQPQHPPGGN